MGQFPLSINIKENMMKQWLKIIHSDKEKIIWLAYHSKKIDTKQNNKRVNCKGVRFNASLSCDDRIVAFYGLLVDSKV